MICYLSKYQKDFGHLVAVDEECNLFTRAWCVAELVCSHRLGIPQNIILHRNKDLELDAADQRMFNKLANIRVEHCEASRPQDKQDILAKIPDLQEFNARLQHMILGNSGLMNKHFSNF